MKNTLHLFVSPWRRIEVQFRDVPLRPQSWIESNRLHFHRKGARRAQRNRKSMRRLTKPGSQLKQSLLPTHPVAATGVAATGVAVTEAAVTEVAATGVADTNECGSPPPVCCQHPSTTRRQTQPVSLSCRLVFACRDRKTQSIRLSFANSPRSSPAQQAARTAWTCDCANHEDICECSERAPKTQTVPTRRRANCVNRNTRTRLRRRTSFCCSWSISP